MAISIAQESRPNVAVAKATGNYDISVIVEHKISALKSYAPMLEQLVAEAVTPNIFYEPWMLFPALESYIEESYIEESSAAQSPVAKNPVAKNSVTQSRATGNSVVFLLVMATDSESGDRCLCGFFPFEEKKFYRRLPLRNVTLWRYPQCFLATPLLHRRFVTESLQSLLHWFQSERRHSLMELPLLSADGQFYSELNGLLAASGVKHFEKAYERALFHPDKDAETCLAKTMTKKSRRNYRRLQRQLSDCGELQWQLLSQTDSIDDWIDDFLDLEASGWKGRSGTALQSTREDRAFFRKMATNAFKRERLLILALLLDGKAIAMNTVLLGEGGGYAFKMAYDESYRRFAPGVLLILELIRQLHGRENFTWLDSCASADHELANRLWQDRKPMCNMVIAKPFTPAAGIVRLLPVLSRFKQGLIAFWHRWRQ